MTDPPREITIAVTGNVDAGKSTLVGVLARNQLDDGNGKARASVFNHPHERETGRTSSIGHVYVKQDQRIVNFIDLCGHSTYLKTTICGLSSQHPDFAIVCVGSNITDMTKEHIRILLAMKIPFMFVVTKIDQTPPDIVQRNVAILKKFAQDCNKKLFDITDLASANIAGLHHVVACIKVSNVTGERLDVLRHFLDNIPAKVHTFAPVFSVQSVYQVTGFGIVVSGYTGIDVRKGDELFMGPFADGHYEKTRVRSIHNDYRESVDTLPAFSKGCLNIKWDSERRSDIKSGMVLAPQPMPSYKRFEAEIVVFSGHHTSIRKGFNAFCNCGSIKAPIRFTRVPKDTIRSGDKAVVEMEFLSHRYFVSPETPIFVREGRLRGYARFLPLAPETNV